MSALDGLEPFRKAELASALKIADPNQRAARLAEMVEFRDEIIAHLRDVIQVKTSPRRVPTLWRLTTTEVAFISTLLDAPGKVVAKEAAYHRVYAGRNLSEDELPEPKILDVILSKIRRKIAGAGHGDIVRIETIWSNGWQMPRECVAAVVRLVEAEELLG